MTFITTNSELYCKVCNDCVSYA